MRRLVSSVVAGVVISLCMSGQAMAWSWPASGEVIRPYANGANAYAAGQHRGVDVAGELGDPVHAPAAGRVAFSGTLPTHGRVVTIETPDGFSVTLTHLGAVSVKKGAQIEEGAVVGAVGPSGTPEHARPYVHLGVRRTAEEHAYVDPLDYLPARELPVTEPTGSPPPPAEPGQAAAPEPTPPPAAASGGTEVGTPSEAQGHTGQAAAGTVGTTAASEPTAQGTGSTVVGSASGTSSAAAVPGSTGAVEQAAAGQTAVDPAAASEAPAGSGVGVSAVGTNESGVVGGSASPSTEPGSSEAGTRRNSRHAAASSGAIHSASGTARPATGSPPSGASEAPGRHAVRDAVPREGASAETTQPKPRPAEGRSTPASLHETVGLAPGPTADAPSDPRRPPDSSLRREQVSLRLSEATIEKASWLASRLPVWMGFGALAALGVLIRRAVVAARGVRRRSGCVM